jgi:hypothetical protein
MDSGEWRYGQREPDDSRSTDAAGEEPTDAPNLWIDDPASSWGSSVSWTPRPRTEDPSLTTAERAAVSDEQRSQAPELYDWGQPARHAATPPPDLPVPISGATGPISSSRGPQVRTGVDNWVRPEPPPRRRVGLTDEYRVVRPRSGDVFGEEPAYGPVLGLTAGWYGVPALFYLVWLVTLDSERQSFVGRSFLASLPWLFAAVVLSVAVAALLRWAVVGWRAMTLSFAAAVIGAGVTTIAHSLAL